MKHLSILRHAKAANYADYADDFQRPLAGRGPEDSARMARFLASLDPKPDWIISSPALRARQTAEIAAQALGLGQAILWEEAVYAASAETLLQVVQAAPERAEHLLLVGHNPGLAELAAGLCSGSVERLALYLPTAGLAHLHSQIFHWTQLRWGAAELRLLLSPKMIKGVLLAAQSDVKTKKAAKAGGKSKGE